MLPFKLRGDCGGNLNSGVNRRACQHCGAIESLNVKNNCSQHCDNQGNARSRRRPELGPQSLTKQPRLRSRLCRNDTCCKA